MNKIDDLTNFFGYYKSNNEFEFLLKRIISKPTNYNNKTLYIVCNETKIEIGFTNEREILSTDKSLVGGRPVFTHFNIYPSTSKIFESLPFGITFLDKQTDIKQKAGQPTKSVDEDMPILGKKKCDIYYLEKIRVSFDYDPNDDTLSFIQIAQKVKTINEFVI